MIFINLLNLCPGSKRFNFAIFLNFKLVLSFRSICFYFLFVIWEAKFSDLARFWKIGGSSKLKGWKFPWYLQFGDRHLSGRCHHWYPTELLDSLDYHLASLLVNSAATIIYGDYYIIVCIISVFKWLKSRFKVKPKSNQGSADTCYDWPVDIRTLSKMTNQGQKKTNFINHNFFECRNADNFKNFFKDFQIFDLGWTFLENCGLIAYIWQGVFWAVI